MRYELNNETVTLYLDNPRREEETVRNQSFAGTGLSERHVNRLVDSIVMKYRGSALKTQERVATSVLRPLFSYFQSSGNSWPTTSTDWQLFVLRFHQFYLTDKDWSQTRAGLRMKTWSENIVGLLEFMKEVELIPHDVVIPVIATKKIQSLAHDQPLLGQPRASPADSRIPPSKLLVNINFGMTDADYLDAVERKCQLLISVIREVCLAHWEGLIKDAETGHQLAAQVMDAEIDEAIATECYSTIQRRGQATKLASSAHPEGHIWAFALIRRALINGSDARCISIDTLRTSPFFPSSLLRSLKPRDWYTALDSLTAMTPDQWRTLSAPARLHRFAGCLSQIDVAAVRCLLTIEHAEFTSESLQNAKLLNVRGKSYLLLTDNDRHSILSVDKPRAGKRKSVVLTDVSQKLVKDILQLTAPIRKVLRRAGDKTWRYLFLGVRQQNRGLGVLGVVEGEPNYLTGGPDSASLSLTRLYPALLQNGLTKGTFDYRRLRNTLGVIRWFETGSIVEMSRRLGNTRKVALEHYLPPALLHAWNARIIRRFQNVLIVLAAHDEPYLLEVTDFTQLTDLQHFIAQMIVEYPIRSSPLADEVQRRLGSKQQVEVGSFASTPGLLNVRLSPKSLSLLYSYGELALRTLSAEELDKVDVLSGLAPRQFTAMATLLRHAAETEGIHASLSESLNIPLLKQVHGQALALKIGIDAQFATLAVKHGWAETQ